MGDLLEIYPADRAEENKRLILMVGAASLEKKPQTSTAMQVYFSIITPRIYSYFFCVGEFTQRHRGPDAVPSSQGGASATESRQESC